jgi:hypothetical protein
LSFSFDYFSVSDSSSKPPIRVVVTGAAGQIGYSLLFMIGSGYVFGSDQKVNIINPFSENEAKKLDHFK